MKMAGKEKFYSVAGTTETASQKRNQQLQVWEKSETNKEPDYILPSRQTPRVRFGDNVVFLAAAQSGDMDEVERLIVEEGADVNSVNKDGLTALHQCCIDDDFDMVQTLVKHGANIDAQDNEGWTPLHAAASCGHEHIVRYLLDYGVFPSPVNNEGDTPADLAEDESIVDMIRQQIDKLGIDVEEVKSVEEVVMLEDANRLKNDPSLKPLISAGGATLLHIAAAKNYVRVMKVLLSLKNWQMQVDAQDEDNWTPLHAAVYWGNMDAAEELVLHGADLEAVTKSGDTVEELCDPEFQDDLHGLKKIQEEQNHRQRHNAIHSSPNIIPRNRPSVVHMNSREDPNKPSPVVRRRSSKERSLAPKLDAMKEREERENWKTETVGIANSIPTQRPSSESIEILEERNNAREAAETTRGEVTNSTKETVNILKEASANSNSCQMQKPSTLMVGGAGGGGGGSSDESQDSSPKTHPKGYKPPSPQGSPKTSKRKPGMSPQMLKRVNLWESQSNLIPAVAPSPLTSTPHTSTNGRREEEGARALPEIKRYHFQSKTIPQTQDPVPPRSQSIDVGKSVLARPTDFLARRSSHEDAINKRGSYDETKLLKVVEEAGAKALSLPRGTKIVSVEGVDQGRGGNGPKENPASRDSKVLKEDAVSSEGTPTPSATTGEEGQRRDGEMSVDSSVSIAPSRTTSEESETRRRSRAKKTRESRKATQLVPENLMEQLQQDALEWERQEDRSAAGHKEQHPQEKKQEKKHERKEEKKEEKESGQFKVVQSAFRPAARPTPKLRPASNPSSMSMFWSSPEKKSEEPPPHHHINEEMKVVSTSAEQSEGSKREVEAVDGGRRGEGDSSPHTPSHPRTKSLARRRPREKRRSTGIVIEAGIDEDIPNELADLVVRKSADTSNMDLSTTSDDYPESLDSSQGEEISHLKQSLHEEQEKCQRLEEDHSRVLSELEKYKERVSELSRRFEDATRAYEQEKREKEQRDVRISELESGSKNLQDLKNENQRLKDENSALIRVIGKLSRAPIHT